MKLRSNSTTRIAGIETYNRIDKAVTKDRQFLHNLAMFPHSRTTKHQIEHFIQYTRLTSENISDN